MFAPFAASADTHLLGAKSLQVHRDLSGALKQAVRWQHIACNPADAVSAPRAHRRTLEAGSSGPANSPLVGADWKRGSQPSELQRDDVVRRIGLQRPIEIGEAADLHARDRPGHLAVTRLALGEASF